MSSCHNGEVISIYCFYPAEHNNLREDGWNISATPQQLIDTFPDLDERVKKLFGHAEDIKMWRLYIHEEYPYWHKGCVALLGDAAHPMLPDQSQGFCQALEDAGALGIIFSKEHARFLGKDGPENYIRNGLRLYEEIRKPRATLIQTASSKARTDLNERIGWSTSTDRKDKLTIEEVCGYDMAKHVREVIASKV
jgi:salicylate hydroxylase